MPIFFSFTRSLCFFPWDIQAIYSKLSMWSQKVLLYLAWDRKKYASVTMMCTHSFFVFRGSIVCCRHSPVVAQTFLLKTWSETRDLPGDFGNAFDC